jgi:hypothetical protein
LITRKRKIALIASYIRSTVVSLNAHPLLLPFRVITVDLGAQLVHHRHRTGSASHRASPSTAVTDESVIIEVQCTPGVVAVVHRHYTITTTIATE